LISAAGPCRCACRTGGPREEVGGWRARTDGRPGTPTIASPRPAPRSPRAPAAVRTPRSNQPPTRSRRSSGSHVRASPRRWPPRRAARSRGPIEQDLVPAPCRRDAERRPRGEPSGRPPGDDQPVAVEVPESTRRRAHPTPRSAPPGRRPRLGRSPRPLRTPPRRTRPRARSSGRTTTRCDGSRRRGRDGLAFLRALARTPAGGHREASEDREIEAPRSEQWRPYEALQALLVPEDLDRPLPHRHLRAVPPSGREEGLDGQRRLEVQAGVVATKASSGARGLRPLRRRGGVAVGTVNAIHSGSGDGSPIPRAGPSRRGVRSFPRPPARRVASRASPARRLPPLRPDGWPGRHARSPRLHPLAPARQVDQGLERSRGHHADGLDRPVLDRHVQIAAAPRTNGRCAGGWCWGRSRRRSGRSPRSCRRAGPASAGPPGLWRSRRGTLEHVPTGLSSRRTPASGRWLCPRCWARSRAIVAVQQDRDGELLAAAERPASR